MKTTRALLGLLICLVALGGAVASEQAEEKRNKWGYAGWDNGFKFESADGANTLQISNRVQVRYSYFDPEGEDTEGAFRIRRYKFKLAGQIFEDWKYQLQVSFAAGSIPGRNDALLEDAWFRYTRNQWVQPWVGQGKAFFGRQLLTSSGRLQFVDRVLFDVGEVPRQIGIGVVGLNPKKTFEYNFGVYNGEGINRSTNPGNHYLWVGRVVFMPFGYYKLAESSLDYPEKSVLAIGAAGTYNIRQPVTETQLIAVGPTFPSEIDEVEVEIEPETAVTRYGVEFAYKIRGFNTVGEYYRIRQEPEGLQSFNTDIWYLQVGYLFPGRHFGVAVRRSEVGPDVDVIQQDTSENAVVFNYYIRGHAYKLQTDFRQIKDTAESVDNDTIYGLRVQFQLTF